MSKKQYHYHVVYLFNKHNDRVEGSTSIHMNRPLNSTKAVQTVQDYIRELNGLKKDTPVVILNFIKLTGEEEDKDVVKTCDTCLYEDGYIDVPPCSECTRAYDQPPSRWEPKEDEG